MKRARGRRSINLNKRRLKAAWYYRGRQGWKDPTGRALFDPDRSWLYVVARDHSQGYRSAPAVFEEGRQYIGGVPFPAGDAAGGANRNFVLATDTTTGEVMWKNPIDRGSFCRGRAEHRRRHRVCRHGRWRPWSQSILDRASRSGFSKPELRSLLLR